MPQDGDSYNEESFNSFLAGVLLTRSHINYFEFFNLTNSFEKTYNVEVVSIGNDISVPIYFDDNEISLRKDKDDVIVIDGRNITIRDYLYSFTSPRVREFFRIPDMKVENVKKPKVLMRILSMRKTPKIAI